MAKQSSSSEVDNSGRRKFGLLIRSQHRRHADQYSDPK
jgi:hypothetical protein